MKEKIVGIDIVRVLCTAGIAMYHYEIPWFNLIGAGYWGGVLVTCFFVMSGFLLQYTVPQYKKNYFWKRWKNIFPSFYVVWIFFFLTAVLDKGKFLWNTEAHPLTLILSVIGMDGFAQIHGLNSYYCTGEWFLGAIIIMYCIYPIILWVINKSEKIFTCFILTLFFIMIISYHFNLILFLVGPQCNLVTCLFSFYMGILCFRHKNTLLKTKFSMALWITMFIVGYYIKIDGVVANTLMGLAIFGGLVIFGELLGKIGTFAKLFSWLANISYCFYLVHHTMVYKMGNLRFGGVYNNSPWLILIYFLITVLLAWCINTITKRLLESKLFIKIDDRFRA